MDPTQTARLLDHLQAESHHGDPFAAAVRATRMPMIVTNPRLFDNPIVFANNAFLALTGYERFEVAGRNCRFLQGPETDPAAVDALRNAVQRQEPITIDLTNYRKDGTTFRNALYLGPVHDEDGQLRYFFASQLDVSERYRLLGEIADLKARIATLERRV